MKEKIFVMLKNNISILLAFLLGGGVFIAVYGLSALEPQNVQWLIYEGEDLAQHYIGWIGYRNSDWLFPPGMTDQLCYPLKTSIIFTDSIPLLAVFFKVFRSALPTEFQYFGLWGLGCYCLTGAVSAKILQKFIRSDFAILIGSIFFITSFQIFQRMYAHTALAGHWVILLAIMIYVYRDSKFSTAKTQMKAWIAMGILASSIHIYFLLMCGIVLVGFLISEYLQTKQIKKVLCVLLSYILSAFLTIYLLGGFSVGAVSDIGGLGVFSFNLNGFFNSMGQSAFFRGLPYREGQTEGFAYVGMGVLLLLGAGTVNSVRCCIAGKGTLWDKSHKAAIVGIISANLIAVIFALSPIVTLGNRVLIEWKLFPMLQQIWGTFRATGRVAWISVYCLMLLGVCLVMRIRPARLGILALMLCCALQLADLSAIMRQKHMQIASNKNYELHLKSEVWQELLEDTDLKHWVIVSDMQWGIDWPDFRHLAAKVLGSHKTLNKFHMARSMEPQIEEQIRRELRAPNADTVYVWKESDTRNCSDAELNLYRVDGFIVGTVHSLKGAEPLEKDSILLNRWEYVFKNGTNLMNGYDENGVRYIHPGGLSYGPYCKMDAGNYKIVIEGENLLNGAFRCYARQGELPIEMENFQWSMDKVAFTIELEQGIDDLEIAIENSANIDMAIKKLMIVP